MESGRGGGRPSFLGRRIADEFDARQAVVAPDRALSFDEAEWAGALVVVEHGQIELEWMGGARRTFGCGAILWLTGLSLRAVRCHGPEPAVLLVLSRCTGSS
jgi:hypothetical protein